MDNMYESCSLRNYEMVRTRSSVGRAGSVPTVRLKLRSQWGLELKDEAGMSCRRPDRGVDEALSPQDRNLD
ncbi:hypothetical protein HAX54_028819 [Datura stramonium]|uniref:Uncharacterized protein n=1 Tax=Datura stramonium TaxID=4076 RepID=A0ABS8V726_DATST|nr:hypothetical protein [Datura stramonium]